MSSGNFARISSILLTFAIESVDDVKKLGRVDGENACTLTTVAKTRAKENFMFNRLLSM